jgi:hypothetical protein
MIESRFILNILQNSPSIDILKLKNRGLIIVFFIDTFYNQQGAVGSDKIHNKLADYLESIHVEVDDESDIVFADSYEIKAKKYI